MTTQAAKLAKIIGDYLRGVGGPQLLHAVTAELGKRDVVASDQHLLTVTSAVSLSPADKSALEAYAKTKLGAKRVVYALDSDLIAGLKLQIGDSVIDHSLSNQLNTLQAQLAK